MADPITDPRRGHLALETSEPMSFGYGFVSGMISALLGLAVLGVTLSLHFPRYFTFVELGPIYSIGHAGTVVQGALVIAFVCGSVSAFLRANKTLALIGIGASLGTALLGWPQPVEGGLDRGSSLSLDFFVLNLLLYSTVFVPMERLFALRRDQPVFRGQWLVDLTYFFFNTLLIEILTIVTLGPAFILFGWARLPSVGAIGSLPLIAQVPALLLVADFTQYWVHRTFHRIPFLWRFHAVHHSIETMDWLAGSRLHLVDVVLTRGLTYVPIFILGFTEQALMVYALIVALQATFIHANVRWTFGPLRAFVATPAFHHWHHSAERQAVDRNFAVHTPIWDAMFGTFYLPDRWPQSYGLSSPSHVPASWAAQFTYPFRKRAAG